MELCWRASACTSIEKGVETYEVGQDVPEAMIWATWYYGDYVGLCWGYIGIMENKMEITIQGIGFAGLQNSLGLFTLIFCRKVWYAEPSKRCPSQLNTQLLFPKVVCPFLGAHLVRTRIYWAPAGVSVWIPRPKQISDNNMDPKHLIILTVPPKTDPRLS